MERVYILLFLAFFIVLMACGNVWAQATAQISGAVQDQSGAVLPGVEVTATQTETGVRRTTVTNETGCSNSFAMICLTRRSTSRQWIRRPAIRYAAPSSATNTAGPSAARSAGTSCFSSAVIKAQRFGRIPATSEVTFRRPRCSPVTLRPLLLVHVPQEDRSR